MIKTKKKKIIISVISIAIICLVLIITKTYSLSKKKTNHIVDREGNYISYTFNGASTNMAFPAKDTGYAVNSVSCTNGTTASWDNDKWGLVNIVSNNKNKVNCNIDFTYATLTVTLDYNDGVTPNTTKQVTYGSKYDTLPVPTRSGYTFVGWNGKNLAKSINSNNYSLYHFSNNTTHEFKEENDIEYIRINGYQAGYADTSWVMRMIGKFSLSENKNYTLSFDTRSLNSTLTQYFSTISSNTSGKTGIYINDSSIGNAKYYFSSNKEFLNDGNWHKISETFTNSMNITNGVLVLGNDIPNLYGANSYIDVSHIQLEEGNEVTDYEPYIIDSDTTVVQTKDHTLTAIWEEN